MKAIIFDCFGVLVEGSLDPMCQKYFPEDSVKRREVLDLEARSSRGELTYNEFLQTCGEWANVDPAEIKAFLDVNPRNEPLLDFIASELKGKYKLGFLSNAADNWMEELFTQDHIALFDDVILSFQHGMSKPDVKIFELAAERLGVQTTDCLFIDDVARYCEGARQTGMKTIQYIDVDQTIKQIKEELIR